ncbi:hypothetical protein GR927_35905 [Mycolicibacterium sp. 3033]|nr:hypothetical protein [Mycolicibacterium aurantiacum]
MTHEYDGPVGQVAVEFLCTDRGTHGPVVFGFITHNELDEDDDAVRFVLTLRIKPGDRQEFDRLDVRCPRCGRHPRYSADTLRRVGSELLAANFEKARATPPKRWGRRQLFIKQFDVSYRD